MANGAAAFGRAALQAAAEHALEAAAHDARGRLPDPAAALALSGRRAAAAGALPLTTDHAVAGRRADRRRRTGTERGLRRHPDHHRGAGLRRTGTAADRTRRGGLAAVRRRGARVAPLAAADACRSAPARAARCWRSASRRSRCALSALPPYSALVGRSDRGAPAPAGADALARPRTRATSAAGRSAARAPPPQPSPWPAGGTLIHVRYRCTAGDCADAAPPDPDAGLRRRRRLDQRQRALDRCARRRRQVEE